MTTPVPADRPQRLQQFVSSPTRRGPWRRRAPGSEYSRSAINSAHIPVLFCTRGTAHRSSEADHPVERLDRQQARAAGRRLVDRSRRGFPTMAISCPETSCWNRLPAHLGGIRDDGEFHRKRNSGVAAKSGPARVFACRTVGPFQCRGRVPAIREPAQHRHHPRYHRPRSDRRGRGAGRRVRHDRSSGGQPRSTPI